MSAKLIDLLRLKPIASQTRSIDMLMSTKVTTLEEYDLSFQSVNHQFTLSVKATKVNKSELLSIDNPNYRELINKNRHLRGVYVHDEDKKARLPVHVVLGSGGQTALHALRGAVVRQTAATSPVKRVEAIRGQVEQGGRYNCCTVARSS